jgi:hypothetical protein
MDWAVKVREKSDESMRDEHSAVAVGVVELVPGEMKEEDWAIVADEDEYLQTKILEFQSN